MKGKKSRCSAVEEVTTGAPGFGVIIHLPVDVVKDRGLIRVGALDRELRGGIRLGAGFFVDRLVIVLGNDPLADEGVLPELDRIMFIHVLLDLFFGAVLLGVRISNGVTLVTIGEDLDNGLAAMLVSTLDSLLHSGPNLVKTDPVDLIPVHVVTLGAGGETLFRESGGAGL